MITYNEGFLISQFVISLTINDLINECIINDEITGSVGTYRNGRENGLILTVYSGSKTLSFAVAEYRNSDDIVVYSDESYFTEIDDKMHRNAIYFNYKSEREVVKHIVKTIKGYFA